jgi:pimeloyl-ACP methyl ester carboxylesterase
VEPPLAATIVDDPSAAPRQNLYFLHGIYGRGRNWAVIARRLRTVRADWCSVLVDLRGHGDSPTAAPPHTVAAAADDVAALSATLNLPIHALLGHSFGGKVALAYAATGAPRLREVWIVDATPASREPDGSAWRMLDVLRQHPGPFASRDAAVEIVHGAGYPMPVARWMASNAIEQDRAYRWRLDVDVMEALMRDFFRQDFWHVIEAPPAGLVVHIVKATKSSILDAAACARIDDAARRHGRVALHRVEAGHWVHTDNAVAIVGLLERDLPRSG